MVGRYVVGLMISGLAFEAAAADFDASSGKVVAQSGDYLYRFDEYFPTLELFGVSGPILESDARARFEHNEAKAIEGSGSVRLGGTMAFGWLPIANADRFFGRRVEMRLWQRPEGAQLYAELYWVIGPRGGDGALTGRLMFQPTGRATDDGWEEWSSGPVDFAMGGTLNPGWVFLEVPEALFDSDSAPTVLFDAFSIQDLGPAAVPAVACSVVNEDQRCGQDGLCLLGRCVDAAPLVGPLPFSAAGRQYYLARTRAQFRHFEGGRGPLNGLAAFEEKLQALESANAAKVFRAGLEEAVNALGDGHAQAPGVGPGFLFPSTVCVELGRADLLPGAPLAPLITSISPGVPWTRGLAPGDALTAIDGLSVPEWRARAHSRLAYQGDEAGRDYATTQALLEAAIGSGAVLELSRCRPLPGEASCPPERVEKLKVDLALAEAGVWNGGVLPWSFTDNAGCDHRFLSPVSGGDRSEYTYAETEERGGIRYLAINGTPSDDHWNSSVSLAFSGTSSRVLLDQRTGFGGAKEAIDLIAAAVLAPEELYDIVDVPQLGVSIEVAQAAFPECKVKEVPACELFDSWDIGSSSMTQATRGHAKDARIAVLNGYDVSGNDYVARVFEHRDPSRTRIFGAVPTVGAYGVIFPLPSLPGERARGSLQVSDAAFLRRPGEAWTGFITGTGVAPQEVVLQLQSDILRGVDTPLAAAERWLREGR